MDQSDEAIARQLLAGSYITHAQYDVWRRANAGASWYSMRKDYPNHKRGGMYCDDTLCHWVNKVNLAIKAARLIDAPAVGERSPWGISIAQGSEVRTAQDSTPQGHVSTETSSWNAERLQAAGAIDRYSRKKV